MFEPTGSPRDAASVLFNLPGYRVLEAVDGVDDSGHLLREVTVVSTAREAACPACGVLSGRVHQVRRSRLRDIPVAGRVEVTLQRRRFVCSETRCGKRTFAESTEQVPLRAKATWVCSFAWCVSSVPLEGVEERVLLGADGGLDGLDRAVDRDGR